MPETKKVVIITGAGGRLGRVFVKKALSEEKIYPVIFTSQPESFLHVSRDKGLVIKVNLNDPNSIKESIGLTYRELGRLDVLINNAATMQVGIKDFVKESTDSRIAEIFKINTLAPIYCINNFLSCGNNTKLVINVLAARACIGHKRHIDYYASKAALFNATRSFAMGYPKHRFRALMLRSISFTNQKGDSPEIVWSSMCNDIVAKNGPLYREIRYGSKLLFFMKSENHILLTN